MRFSDESMLFFLNTAKDVRPSLQSTLFSFQKKVIWILVRTYLYAGTIL